MRVCVLSVLLFCLVASAFAGWEPTVRLTTSDSATHNSLTPARSIAAGPTGFIHVVFYDNRTGSQQVYYKRSVDSGSTWSADTPLSNGTGFKAEPAVAASGGYVHAVWEDRDSGVYNAGITYRRSTDYGATWGADARLSGDLTNGSYNPCIAVDSGLVHVGWWDTRTAPYEIYYKNSPDEGATWGDDVRLTDDTTGSYNMTVAARGSAVHVMWEALYGTSFIMYKSSTDGGGTWSTDTALTVTPDYWSVSPSATMDGSDVHLIWTDFRDSEYGEIYYKRKPASGAGVEEAMNDEWRAMKNGPTVLSGSKVQSLESVVLFDAMGRRTLNPKSGVYFVVDLGGGAGDDGRTHKIIIQR